MEVSWCCLPVLPLYHSLAERAESVCKPRGNEKTCRVSADLFFAHTPWSLSQFTVHPPQLSPQLSSLVRIGDSIKQHAHVPAPLSLALRRVTLLLTTQVRSAATATLQTAVVSAEVLGVLPGSLERGLREWMLPPLEALSKKMGGKGKRDLPQVSLVPCVWFVWAVQ